MAPSAKGVLIICLSLWVLGAFAQLDTGGCGTNINASRPWYEIRFTSYCNTRFLGVTFPPTQQATFEDCSTTCVEAGITCGGFTYDRDSHISAENCYLLRATSDAYEQGSSSENFYFDSAKVDNGSIPITRRDCESVGTDGVYRGFNLRCNEGIFDNSGGSAAQLETVFASSITDCIDHCYSAKSDTGNALCQAVTWDPSMVSGYQNCILKGPNYVEPVAIGAWDSATLVGTVGRLLPNASTTSTTSANTGTASSSTSSASSSSSSPSPTILASAGGSQPSKKLTGGQIGAIAGSISGFAALSALAIVFCMRYNIKRSVNAHNARAMRGNPAGFFNAIHEIFSPREDKGKAREIDGKEVRVAELEATTFSELESPVVPSSSIAEPSSSTVKHG